MVNVITKHVEIDQRHIKEGALILVDKPLTWTSFDVVNKIRHTIRHRLGVKKYKVGHAGTLDPLATGLLIVCISKYTKRLEELSGLEKSYHAVVRLGADTPSMDAELQPHVYYPSKNITEKQVAVAIENFKGEIKQIPPMYSAIKVKGRALYKSARAGKVIHREPRTVYIHELGGELKDPGHIDLIVRCSKGTYIRTLAQDIAHSLDTGGYLSYLRRTQIGTYSVNEAYQIDDLVRGIERAELISADDS